MAAVYLHNAIHSRTSPETRETIEHSRNLSAISCATLLTNTTLHSQTNEPLLRPTCTELPEATRTYYDQVSRQPRNAYGSAAQLRWDDGPIADADPNILGEKEKFPRRRTRKPWRRRKRVKVTFEIVICAWAVYNTVRYFTAFTIYGRDASTGQVVALTLGASAGISFALAFCSLILSAVKDSLLTYGLAYRYLTRICLSMHCLSSILLFAPAAVNFALLFIWKNSSDSHYNLAHRCHLDIDTLWSPTANPCNNRSPSWTVWLVLSSLRLAFTLLILLMYHIVAFLYPDPPRRPMHHRLRSGSQSFVPTPSSSGGGRPSLGTMLPHSNQDLHVQHYTSDMSLDDATLRGDASPPSSHIRLARSHSSGFSGETTPGEPISFGRSTLPESDGVRDQNGYADRFRSLLSQIAQETEEALAYARNEQLLSPENNAEPTPSPNLPPFYSPGDYSDESDDEEDIQFHDQINDDHNNNIFNLPPVPPALGYNEFGLPYPPDQDVRVLNGYIRRMPTIESMGSGEIGSSIGASSACPGSIYTSSRPPTRNTLLSFNSAEYEVHGTSSDPPSRANSLSARAELLAGLTNVNGMSEHGELLGRSDIAMRRMSSPTSFLDSPLAGPAGDTCSSTGSHRTSILSYHTATMGSATGDSYMPSSPLDPTTRFSRTRENDS